MFKKLKDKIAEEVKQSPQRFQELAQAAQVCLPTFRSLICYAVEFLVPICDPSHDSNTHRTPCRRQ